MISIPGQDSKYRPGNRRANGTFLKLLRGHANALLRGRDICVSLGLLFGQRSRLHEILVVAGVLVICLSDFEITLGLLE